MPIWGQVELLCRAVAEEGDKEAEQILAQARADAAEVLAAARERADKEFEEELLARKSDAYADAKRTVDSAELEVKKRIMAFREQVIQEVLGALEQRLQAYRKEPRYVEFLLSALKEGFEHLPGKEFVVELNGTDLGLLEGELEKLAVEGSLQIDVKASSPCEGGVRVTTRDRRLLYDNSFAARLKRSEDEIRQEIWRVIFGTQTTAI
jgi:V/A-type H+/Na+-transporting ATPase subunit E